MMMMIGAPQRSGIVSNGRSLVQNTRTNSIRHDAQRSTVLHLASQRRGCSPILAKASSGKGGSSGGKEPTMRPLGETSPTPPPPREDLTPSDAEVVPLTASRLLPASDSRFQGLKAFVAGAAGRTGRRVVSRLVDEGVPVRALVRNAIKAVEVLPGLDKNVEIIEGDVYKYQTLPTAMEGCNVVIIATGATSLGNLTDPYKVDYEGTLNIISVAQRMGIKKVVLVSSIGVDELLSPFNLFGGLAFWKKQAELALQRSGLDYTIVRPGGLRDEPAQGQKMGGVVMGAAGDYGLLPGQRFPTSPILRSQVADVVVDALIDPAASGKVVEIVTEASQPNRPYSELFGLVP